MFKDTGEPRDPKSENHCCGGFKLPGQTGSSLEQCKVDSENKTVHKDFNSSRASGKGGCEPVPSADNRKLLSFPRWHLAKCVILGMRAI